MICRWGLLLPVIAPIATLWEFEESVLAFVDAAVTTRLACDRQLLVARGVSMIASLTTFFWNLFGTFSGAPKQTRTALNLIGVDFSMI